MNICEIKLTELIDFHSDLLNASYCESGVCSGDMNINRDIYHYLDEHSPSFGLLATNDDGEAVAVAAVIVTAHSHQKDLLTATNDIIYVKPDWRGRTLTARLMALCESKAKEAGAQQFRWDFPADSLIAKAFDRRRSFDHKFSIYVKEL